MNLYRKAAALLVLGVVAFAGVASSIAAQPDFQRDVLPALKKHCFKCHGSEKQKSDLRLDDLSTDLLNDRPAAETWHDVLNTLNRGEMPPEDESQFSDKERRAVIGWLTREIDRVVEAQRKAGSGVVLRRLNRVEYNNTMRDLLGIDDDYARDLPPDSASKDGFRNNGAALRISDMQLEYYLKAAREALAKVIVTGPAPKVHHGKFETAYNEGGRRQIWTNTLSRWGTFVSRLEEYPDEGGFIVRIKARAIPSRTKGHPRLAVNVGLRADVSSPSKELGQADVVSAETQAFEFHGRMEQFPRPSRTQSKFPGLRIWARNVYTDGTDPGKPKQVTVQDPVDPNLPKKEQRKVKRKKRRVWQFPDDPDFPQIVIESLEFEGPVFAQWPPKHHTDILFSSPLRDSDEAAYAWKVLRRFMTRAFRRPVSEAETGTYFGYYEKIRGQSESLEIAMREALAMALVSPDFLYLVEPASAKERRDLNDHELASRLSYFLSASMPDERLRKAADAGDLAKPDVLRREARRLLKSESAGQFVEQFTDQWLDLGAIDRVAINPEFYPDFDNALKPEMRREAQAFFAEILRNDLSALNLLDSDFAVVNERLARHYGIKGPKGMAFERVALKPKDRRGGLLTQGAILLGNSTGADSHPIKRAVWLRERLLDDPPPPPPPNVPGLDPEDPDFARKSVREQLEIHRKDPACNDCHRGIDPWGVALEEFGADGLFREQILRKEKVGKRLKDVRVPVVAEAVLPGSDKVEGIAGLKRFLVNTKKEQFARALTSRLLAFALGRDLELGDEKIVDQLSESFATSDYNLRRLIEAIVVSEPFLSK